MKLLGVYETKKRAGMEYLAIEFLSQFLTAVVQVDNTYDILR